MPGVCEKYERMFGGLRGGAGSLLFVAAGAEGSEQQNAQAAIVASNSLHSFFLTWVNGDTCVPTFSCDSSSSVPQTP